jgi:hypothetical protein
MVLRQRTVAVIGLICATAIFPVAFLYGSGRDVQLVMATVLACATYLLALALHINDRDRSISSLIVGFLFAVVGLFLAFVTLVMFAFSGNGTLFG